MPKISEKDAANKSDTGPEPRKRGSFIPETHGSRLDALMDVIRFGPEKLPYTEFLALLFHAERSLPYGKDSDAPSLNQMTNGIQKRNGERIRGSAGLSKSSCAKANAALEEKRLIKRTRQVAENGSYQATAYEIDWKELQDFFFRDPTEQGADPSPHDGQGVVRTTDKPLVRHTDNPSPHNGHQQSRFIQSSSSSEKKETESSAFPKTTGIVATPRKPAGEAKTAVSSEKQSVPQQQNPKPLNSLSDDDDDLFTTMRRYMGKQGAEEQPKRKPDPDPNKEFELRMKERHANQPGFDAEQLRKTVQAELYKGNASIQDFLDYDAQKTTAPDKVSNPGGYYRATARELVRGRSAAVLEEIFRVREILVPKGPDPNEYKCSICFSPTKGHGIVEENGRIRFCDCANDEYRNREDRKRFIEDWNKRVDAKAEAA